MAAFFSAKIGVVPSILLLTGTLVFGGSLYLLAITGVRWLGAITPIGGVCLISGYIVLAYRGGRIATQ